MKKKLLNRRRDAYQDKVAVLEICQMLTDFVLMKRHTKEVRTEQSPIDGWDDIWVEQFDASIVHLQVKRQNEDMKDQLKSAFNGISKWLNTADAKLYPNKRKCVIAVPALTFNFAPNLQILRLNQLCDEELTKFAAEDAGDELAKQNEFKAIFDWIKKVVANIDNNEVANILRLVKIRGLGQSPEVDAKSISLLAQCFSTPSFVRDQIEAIVNTNLSIVNQFTPRKILGSFSSYLLPTIPIWTQYEFRGPHWSKSGIIDITDSYIERPHMVVSQLWNPTRLSYMLLQAPTQVAEDLISRPIIRLALHFRTQAFAMILDRQGWEAKAWEAIGHTFGEEHHLASVGSLNIQELAQIIEPSEICELDQQSGTLQEDEALNDAMSAEMLNLLCNFIDYRINKLDFKNPLRSLMIQRFNKWKQILVDDQTLRDALFEQMMKPTAEGKRIAARLRVGPKTVHLIGEAMFMLLALSVSLGGSDDDLSVAFGDSKMKAIAVKAWSGPASEDGRLRKISKSESASQLLEADKTEILILAGTERLPVEIVNQPIAPIEGQSFSLAAKHGPVVLITNSGRFQDAVEKGAINEIRNSILEKIKIENEMEDTGVIRTSYGS